MPEIGRALYELELELNLAETDRLGLTSARYNIQCVRAQQIMLLCLRLDFDSSSGLNWLDYNE